MTATIGQFFLTKAFAAGAPAKVSVVGLTQIVFSVLLAAMFFETTYSWTKVVGMALVVIPTAWLMTHPTE